MKRAAIISGGGGNIGYFAGYWSVTKPDYDTLLVNSASSPIAIPLALKKYQYIIDKILELDNTIYKDSPFRKNGKLKILRGIWNLITTDGVADMSGMVKFIDNNLIPEFWEEIQKTEKEIVVSVTNYNYYRTKLELVSSKNTTFDFFKKMVYASCLYHPMVRGLSFAGTRYHDGGHRETILVDEAIDRGYKPEEIDVYILREYPENTDIGEPKNWLDSIQRTWRAYEDIRLFEDLDREIKRGNILESNVYWMPKQISGNPMNFDPAILSAMVEQGKNDATK